MFEAVVEVGKDPTAATDCGGHVQESFPAAARLATPSAARHHVARQVQVDSRMLCKHSQPHQCQSELGILRQEVLHASVPTIHRHSQHTCLAQRLSVCCTTVTARKNSCSFCDLINYSGYSTAAEPFSLLTH